MRLVFVDRDGVINEELPERVRSPEELTIFPAALRALTLLDQQGFTVVVITNQSIVGRGLISEATLARIHDVLCAKVKAAGGMIADIFYCTDAPDCPTYRRKPKPGMLLEALEKYNGVAADTPFIGDAATDLEAATAAGCPRYLVLTGKGKHTADSLAERVKPVTICADIFEAAKRIVEKA